MTTATAPKTTTFKTAALGTVVLTTYVDPCPGKIGTDKVPSTCGRCGGRGGFDCYGHIYQGRCFECGGAGSVPTTVTTVRKRAKLAAFQAEFAEELAAARQAAHEAAAVAAAAAEAEAAAKAEAAEAARRAAMVQGFLGEIDEVVTVTGTVKVAKYISGSYNRSSSMFLIINLDSGQVVKIFGSSQSLFSLERGHRVEVTGKVKKHENYDGQDQTVLSHAKAVVLEEADAV